MEEATATFGAGCFWHVELAFGRIKGVLSTSAGYMGGWFENPSYEDVCCGGTDHAEVVLVTYDPAIVAYEELLKKFWAIHDPTTPNRQGVDVGTQYRSVIFYYNEAQKAMAEASQQAMEASEAYPAPIVTEIKPAGVFYPAEEYHQKYLEKRGKSSC